MKYITLTVALVESLANATVTDAITETLHEIALSHNLSDADDSEEFNWMWCYSESTHSTCGDYCNEPCPAVEPRECSMCDGSGHIVYNDKTIQCRECFERNSKEESDAGHVS